ncbi:MAG TPA: metallophosphoesterase family protein [Alphaproteobacteria bacterium]
MRLLAVSDIHGNVDAVRRLRDRERNDFDAVVVAGDIGSTAAPDILGLLASFACPVLYVFGNWDSKLPYDASFGPNCHHLHLRSVECGGWAFAGFSGLPAHWGLNPLAAAMEQELRPRRQTADRAAKRRHAREVQRRNRASLADVIASSRAGQKRTIVVTHERQYRVHEDMPDVPLFLFGHRHGFESATFRGAQFVNVSVLDDALPPRDDISLGTYTILELSSHGIEARPVPLHGRRRATTRQNKPSKRIE